MKAFSKDHTLAALALWLLIFLVSLFRPFHPFWPVLAGPNEDAKIKPEHRYLVEVAGAVDKPGVYTFDNSPTTYQVIRTAGARIQACQIHDTLVYSTHGAPNNGPVKLDASDAPLDTGTRVELNKAPGRSPEIMVSSMSPRNRFVLGIPVDANEAAVEDLVIIPGIGPTLARRIVSFRQSHGPLTTLEDLTRVNGIGRSKLAAVRSYLYVSDTST